jgi:hypothetical protein
VQKSLPEKPGNRRAFMRGHALPKEIFGGKRKNPSRIAADGFAAR